MVIWSYFIWGKMVVLVVVYGLTFLFYFSVLVSGRASRNGGEYGRVQRHKCVPTSYKGRNSQDCLPDKDRSPLLKASKNGWVGAGRVFESFPIFLRQQQILETGLSFASNLYLPKLSGC